LQFFIFDYDTKKIGVIYNNLYYTYGINNSSPEQIGSIVNNEKILLTDSLRNYYKTLTDAFYETARYMLYNNRNNAH